MRTRRLRPANAVPRGIFSSGYHASQAAIAPKGYLTGAEWNWETVYSNYAKLIQSGKKLADGGIPHLVRGGLKEGFVKLSPYGPAVGDAAKKDADAAKNPADADRAQQQRTAATDGGNGRR